MLAKDTHIIVPAAGLSTRFPTDKPKYLWFAHDGRMMIDHAIRRYIDAGYPIHIGILKDHDEKFHASKFLYGELGEDEDIDVIVLDELTSGPAATVEKIIQYSNIPMTAPIFIKDCDSSFDFDIDEPYGDFVCVGDLQDIKLSNPANKSYATFDVESMTFRLSEKKVVSNQFVVGGYGFKSARSFKTRFASLGFNFEKEIFVSHVMNVRGFNRVVPVTNYVDLGTFEDWEKFNDKPLIFCDIDGTLIKAQSRYGSNTYSDPPVPLVENIKAIKAKIAQGAYVIFVTARPDSSWAQTHQMLVDLGFDSPCHLMTGAPNSKRILINDYNDANPFPRAEAINIKRNADNLKDFL